MMRRPVKTSTVMFLAALTLVAPSMDPLVANGLAGFLLFLAMVLWMGGE